MTQRIIFSPLAITTGLFSFLSCSGTSEDKPSPVKNPNIIIILADDMGYGDPTCYNPESEIPTPNIDRIAQQGIRLTDAYAHPWCVPSRYGMITGRHPLNSQLNWRDRSLIGPGQITIASLLRRNNYYTAMVGKWHLGFDSVNWDNVEPAKSLRGGPVDHGFDYFFGIHASLDIPPYFYIENDRAVVPPVSYINASRSPDATRPTSGEFWRAGKTAPGFKHKEVDPAFAGKAVEFINDYNKSGKNQPFFLFLSLASPHTPWLPTSEFEGKSGAGSYGDFVMQVDNTVGKVMGILKQSGLEDETLLIFTSDNGPLWYIDDIKKYDHRAAGRLRGMKNDVWEGGHRIPFVAQWPGNIPANIVRDDIVSFEDLLSTLAAVTGDNLPERNKLDSYNMLPVLLNEAIEKPIREKVIIYDNAIRKGEWKFIDGSGEGRVSRRWVNDSSLLDKDIPGELYNLKDDVSEQNNLYYDKPGKARDLLEELNAYKNNISTN